MWSLRTRPSPMSSQRAECPELSRAGDGQRSCTRHDNQTCHGTVSAAGILLLVVRGQTLTALDWIMDEPLTTRAEATARNASWTRRRVWTDCPGRGSADPAADEAVPRVPPPTASGSPRPHPRVLPQRLTPSLSPASTDCVGAAGASSASAVGGPPGVPSQEPGRRRCTGWGRAE